MAKRKNDYRLKVLEKLLRKKQISLVISVAFPLLTKQRTATKQRRLPPLQCQEQ